VNYAQGEYNWAGIDRFLELREGYGIHKVEKGRRKREKRGKE
jgi:hypothetical protein